MSKFIQHARKPALMLSAFAWILAAGTAFAALIPEVDNRTTASLSPLLNRGTTEVEPLVSDEDILRASYLIEPLTKGLWSTACARATKVLAKQQPVVDALGVFAMCAAIRNDMNALNTALKRLKEVESMPHYYEQLAQGIVHLNTKSPEKAAAIFKNVLQQRPDDPLALYFAGEASHALGRNTEAISRFKSSLDTWPDHAPALSALARLSISGNASKSALQSAMATAEHATRIDTTNRAYWQQLADLCDRAGEHGRANAIRLQWLTPRSPK